MENISKRPVALLAAFVVAGLVIGLWAVRAPTSFTGGLPFVGDKFPIEINVIYFVILGPIVAMLCAAGLWVLAANDRKNARVPMLLSDMASESILLSIIFGLISVLSIVLSLLYFLVLAPATLCATRPHFEFLWTNIPGPERITHCMSDTKDVNNHSPYYFEPQILQSWGQVLWPVLTIFFLTCAWRSSTKASKST
jgi:hypothetical protein